jgi:Helix-turn-helix domain
MPYNSRLGYGRNKIAAERVLLDSGLPVSVGGFYRRSQHPEIIWGCVVVVSSCEEGAGAASPVGQASAVHGVAREGVEHPRRRAGGRCFPDHGQQLGARLQAYRHGNAIGFVAPLERLPVRQISSRVLSQDERIEIADLHHTGVSIRQIAARLGRAPSTISREFAPQLDHRSRLPPFRGSSACHRPSGASAPATAR